MIQADSGAEFKPSGLPDLTALLDVIFILLVFLLLTANAVPKALKVSLPTDEHGQSRSVKVKNTITITLFPQPQKWGLQQQAYNNWAAFEQALLAQVAASDKPQILLVGDKNTSLQKLLQIFGWLQSRELSAAQIMMQPHKSINSNIRETNQ
ncbi:MAG: biopolymer transporter ExbD [Algicola sp.]|nr:biopolymer transporter ExbD [Algicola sp.]